MKKHKHNFRAIQESTSGHYGVLLFCIHCGKPYSYNEDWELIDLRGE